jgi:4-alpha-glucanotransferase
VHVGPAEREKHVKRPYLRALADRVGIIPEYTEQTGRYVRRTTDATREIVLSIMGIDAPTEAAARGGLAELDHEDRKEILAPVRVVRRDDPRARRVKVQLPEGVRAASIRATLTEETGRTHQARVQGSTIELPALPYGYHALECRVSVAGREWNATQSFIVVPSNCTSPRELLGDRDRVMGVVANLYSVRREEDWGVGDFTTFMQLVEWTASRRGAFVGINPLHALWNRGMDVSPYGPVSRLFRNPIYIDVERVPELEYAESARAMLATPGCREKIAALRARSHVDYDAVIALKDSVLTELFRVFRARASAKGPGAKRFAEYEQFTRKREPELTHYATWMTLAESSGVPDWRVWPESMRDIHSESVQAYARDHADRITFHKWLQFETDRQLGEVAVRAKQLGMSIGAYQDLAVGTSPSGSDVWSDPQLFCEGASIGAPPDQYSSTGQVWGLPPINPRVLRQERYRYWTLLLRRAFDHSGALRIDHVIGLFRSFWVPNGAGGREGAYVRFPADDLLGILALESTRHNAIVVGEDLGTVPPEVPPALKKWGILSSKILYFEFDERGFLPAKRYPALSLATANTHDMAPLAGWWTGRELDIRENVGTLFTPEELRRARRERTWEKRELAKRLNVSLDVSPSAPELVKRAHDFLCESPAVLVGESFDDLLGETMPVNVPGTGQDKYPNWRRKTSMTIEEAVHTRSVDEAMGCEVRRHPPTAHRPPAA